MGRGLGRLTTLKVARASKPGLYPDGGGLYLQITSAGAKSWVYRFMLAGKARTMGLGSLNAVGLADAREKAADCRKLRAEGVDPIEARKRVQEAARLDAARTVTFRKCGDGYIAAHRHSWRNKKHAAQWTSTLETYAYPFLGNLPAQGVDTGLVLKVLEPIWRTKPETAGRIRGRIEAVLDWATVRGYRRGDNPARWRGHLDKLLPARSKVQKVKHHPALAYAELPAFVSELREIDATASRALQFLILTATRTGEVIGAKWSEIDGAGTWMVPEERMKGGREHRVPLSPPALAVVATQRKVGGNGDYIFPGRRMGKPLSNMAMLKLLERMERDDLTAHGFRSTFRDWAAERTSYPREVAEMCLAHAIEDKVEAAYRRGDLFEKRKRLMSEWGRYCTTPKIKGKVVQIGATRA
jgi:integrase